MWLILFSYLVCNMLLFGNHYLCQILHPNCCLVFKSLLWIFIVHTCVILGDFCYNLCETRITNQAYKHGELFSMFHQNIHLISLRCSPVLAHTICKSPGIKPSNISALCTFLWSFTSKHHVVRSYKLEMHRQTESLKGKEVNSYLLLNLSGYH